MLSSISRVATTIVAGLLVAGCTAATSPASITPSPIASPAVSSPHPSRPSTPPGTPTATAASSAPGTWTATTPMIEARAEHTATLLPEGRVLVAGGYLASAELYDPTTGVSRLITGGGWYRGMDVRSGR